MKESQIEKDGNAQTRRIGHESATREAVKEVVENKTAHDKARNARFSSTGEGQCESVEDVA